jgi:signal transduction histidine kinase
MAATALPEQTSVARPPVSGPPSVSWLPQRGRQLLGVPLALKLAGANVIVLTPVMAAAWAHSDFSREDIPVLAVALAVSFAISTALAVLALEPVRALERAGRRILAGELDARVQVSILADRDVRRVALVMNNLLEALTSERERIRELALRVVAAHDDERARIARELEDSTAQGLAALLYELRAEFDRTTDADLRNRLRRLSDMLGGSIEELRTVTSVVHPRVLTDLGIGPALQCFARGMRSRYGVLVDVTIPHPAPWLPASLAAALFAAAREAGECLASIIDASHIRIALEVEARCAQLVVESDGEPLPSRQRSVLTEALRQRVGLVEGWGSIEQSAKGGTAVVVIIPITLE